MAPRFWRAIPGAALLLFALLGPTPGSAADRDGLAAGSLIFVPGLRLEGGFDSNPRYQPTDSIDEPAAVLVINPYLGIRTQEPRMMDIQADLGLAWEQLWGLGDLAGAAHRVNEQSGLDVDTMLGLRINPQGMVSFAPRNTLTWSNKPNLSVSGDPYRVLHNRFELGLSFHPGGYARRERTSFSGEATFLHRLWSYDEVPEFNRSAFGGRLRLVWNFLPRTALFADGSAEASRFDQASMVATTVQGPLKVDNIDSNSVRAVLGMSGLLSRRLSLLASGGYGAAWFDQGRDLRTWLAQVELGVHFSDDAKLRFGWDRSFETSLVSRAMTSHRIYADTVVQRGRLGFGLRVFAQINDYTSALHERRVVNVYNGDRTDTLVGGRIDLNFALTRWLTLGARYSPAFRDSTATFADARALPLSSDYLQHRAFLTLDFAPAAPLPLAGISGSPFSPMER